MSYLDRWEPVIGLEVHVQLRTESKIFSGSSTAFGLEPNAATDSVVLGLPGCLPVLNKAAVEMALRLGLAVGGRIAPVSRFARKHYFYPDLPKGFQISQNDEPVVSGGAIAFRFQGQAHVVPLTRIHMEEDAGKSIHAEGGVSLVDYNRAGVPLCEVVSDPAIRSADEAAEYLKALRTLVRYLGVSDGNMEEGSLRCDANVSVRPRGSNVLGTRTELKNINSFKNVKDAIEHEIKRQIGVIERGEKVVQETRLWDAAASVSRSMRSKEEAHDYRYFPEPDLPPLAAPRETLEAIRKTLPELPEARYARYVEALGLPEGDAGVLTAEREIAEYFEAVLAAFDVADKSAAKKCANWVINDILGRVADARELSHFAGNASRGVSPSALAGLIALVESGTLSTKLGKDVLAKMWGTGSTADAIVQKENLAQVSDTGAIESAVAAVIDAHPSEVERLKGGDKKLTGFFVGQVMKATGGKANPKTVNEMLRKLLGL